jgi:hypothetical protein
LSRALSSAGVPILPTAAFPVSLIVTPIMAIRSCEGGPARSPHGTTELQCMAKSDGQSRREAEGDHPFLECRLMARQTGWSRLHGTRDAQAGRAPSRCSQVREHLPESPPRQPPGQCPLIRRRGKATPLLSPATGDSIVGFGMRLGLSDLASPRADAELGASPRDHPRRKHLATRSRSPRRRPIPISTT